MERNSTSSDSSYAVHIKDEPEFNQQVQKTEVVVEVEHIKEELEWDSGASCVSEAEPGALYPDHVKEELELGPEGLQPADAAFTLYAQALDIKREPDVKDCVVMLDRIEEAQDPGTAYADVTHEYSDTDTEKEYYVCDICNWKFKLKSRLKEHVMVHIHVSTEEENVEVVLSAETAEDHDSDHYDHAYAKSESPELTVTAFECGKRNKKSKRLRQVQRFTRTHSRVKPYSSSFVDETVTDSDEEIDVVSLGPQLPLAATPYVSSPSRTWHTRRRKCFPSTAAVAAAPRYGLRARSRRRLRADSDSDTHTRTNRKESHNAIERFRRYCLKQRFNELREQIPKIKSKEGAPKILIIREATKLCNELREEQKRLGKQQRELMTKFRKLRSMAKRVKL